MGPPVGRDRSTGRTAGRILQAFWQHFRSKTRDTSEYGLKYISGLLGMKTDRHLANVGRKTRVARQSLQQFVSHLPWSGDAVVLPVETEIKAHPAFQEARLVLDESAEEKAGEHRVGTGRQHNGRLGKIEMSQVGVFLAFLSNAPETMAWRKTHRYLIERSNEEAKDAFGWDEFQTRKYRAWKPQLALTILASWLVAETRLDWQQRFEQSGICWFSMRWMPCQNSPLQRCATCCEPRCHAPNYPRKKLSIGL